MEKMTAEKLREYCQSVVKRHGKPGRDWAFGAIEFAFFTDAITPEEFGIILEEFELVPPGSMQRSLNCSEGKVWEEAERQDPPETRRRSSARPGWWYETGW